MGNGLPYVIEPKENMEKVLIHLFILQKISPYDGLPQSYCTKCQRSLQACSSFRRLCAISAQQLQSIVKDRLKMDTTVRRTKDRKPSNDRKSVVMRLEIEQLETDEAEEDEEETEIIEMVAPFSHTKKFKEDVLILDDEYFKIENVDDDDLEDIRVCQILNQADFDEETSQTSQTEAQSLVAELEDTYSNSEGMVQSVSVIEDAEAQELNEFLVDNSMEHNEYYSVVYENDIEDNETFRNNDDTSDVGEMMVQESDQETVNIKQEYDDDENASGEQEQEESGQSTKKPRKDAKKGNFNKNIILYKHGQTIIKTH